MIKCTQTIRRLLPTNCLSVLGILWGRRLRGLKPVTIFAKKLQHKTFDRVLNTPLENNLRLIFVLFYIAAEDESFKETLMQI